MAVERPGWWAEARSVCRWAATPGRDHHRGLRNEGRILQQLEIGVELAFGDRMGGKQVDPQLLRCEPCGCRIGSRPSQKHPTLTADIDKAGSCESRRQLAAVLVCVTPGSHCLSDRAF